MLLEWLDPNLDLAGEKYEEIRRGLIKIFGYRGCSDAEGLADETINRVARAASRDESRPVLTGILVQFTAGMLVMAATDSIRYEGNSKRRIDPAS